MILHVIAELHRKMLDESGCAVLGDTKKNETKNSQKV